MSVDFPETSNNPNDATERVIRAAGCVVWRWNPDKPKQKQVLLIHRPHRSDWSHPKGKLDPGESELECAVREVKEETGFTGELGPELPMVTYRDHKNRPKSVRYWLLRCADGQFVANDEVDEIVWTSRSKASRILTYQHDVDLLEHL